ncbi:hypothetical protein GCM10010168_25040 [Actinoplanes ianthinogenes]|uniref:Uncharacterized protein n=2 Tax=Actinoplanes ianthinogenes TaxID=122358 RepID=A0ABM7M922_9ACTN|nr:hypothetical protein Aiant_88010 [Actinoplanes ianthinogenes]GGR06740.1 hypothetical protein GCM10010168_25040 [Actinoplanes ianthinogenes]
MGALEAASWGLLGGLIVEVLEYSAAIRRSRGRPWRRRGEPGFGPSLVALLLRLAAGAGLAAAAAAGRQISGGFAALALGVTAPLVVEKVLGRAGTHEIPPADQLPAGEADRSDGP